MEKDVKIKIERPFIYKAYQLQKDVKNNEILQTLANAKFLFKKQSIPICRIYSHFFEPIDWFFLLLALIGSIGSGVAMPLMSFLTSEVYSDVGNTSEQRYSADSIANMIEIVKETMDDQIKKQLMYGGISFVCNF